MRKLLVILAFIGVSHAAMAQDDQVSDAKHSVVTNSFWSNWFIQANAVGTSFWGSQESTGVKFSKLFKSYRTNLGFSVALGKWFTPGLGLRTKFNGVWGRSVISEDKSLNASRYWTLHEQALFNLSNMLMGYNEERVWDFIPYAGAGISRNMSYNAYSMGLSVGILNTFNLSRKVALNLDINYGIYGAGADGFAHSNANANSLKTKDRMVSVEVGFTYRLGSATWRKVVDTDAQSALAESEIDALNAQLADALAENERLAGQLSAQQPAPVVQQPAAEPQLVSAPVSVFFDLNKSAIASRRELQNVADLVALARQQHAKLVVTGYADSATGNADYNRQLSQQRADAVVAEIVKLGFAREDIEVVAAGGVDNLSPSPYNRRVTVALK